MKTLDEVIKLFEAFSNERYDLYEGPAQSTVTDALHYLKHLQEYYEMSREHHEPNPALTWNELKAMEGKPVWVEWTKTEESYWCFVGEWFDDDEMRIYHIGRDYADYIHKTVYTPDIVQAYRKERE